MIWDVEDYWKQRQKLIQAEQKARNFKTRYLLFSEKRNSSARR